MKLQIDSLKSAIDQIHKKYGSELYESLYGAGCTRKPRVLLLFMNPTAKNVTVSKGWDGIRAPWIGIRTTWSLMMKLGIIDSETADVIKKMKPIDWTPQFAQKLYEQVARNGVYITNFARCTLPDSRHVPEIVFHESREVILKEIAFLDPQIIISFGNQVSSHLLKQHIKVSDCRCQKHKLTITNKVYPVFPTYYPVGMGMRNMSKAIADMREIFKTLK